MIMDLSRFSIDATLSEVAGTDDPYRSALYEKLASGLFEHDENLYVKTDILKDREAIFLFPAFHWLMSKKKFADRGRVLYLCSDSSAAESLGKVASDIAGRLRSIGNIMVLAKFDRERQDIAELSTSPLLIATLEAFSEAVGKIDISPRTFGFVIADQAEIISELPGESIRRSLGTLLPAWERKTLVITAKGTPKAKNFAWDFADNPKEIKLDESIGNAVTTKTISRDVKEADKIRFILQLLNLSPARRFCVFCNLKSTAMELAAKLSMNAVPSDYIAGNLDPEKKMQIVAKALGKNAKGRKPAASMPSDSFVLVLTDEGAKGIEKPGFPVVINYDMPLEPELYFERLAMLDGKNDDAVLYNFVCERYMYGLPAIERVLDASLSVSPLDSGLALPEDMSRGKPLPMPEPKRRFDRNKIQRKDPLPALREKVSGTRQSNPSAPPDPYSMSMEERMEHYRHKYGKKLDQGSAGKPAGRPGNRARGRIQEKAPVLREQQPSPSALVPSAQVPMEPKKPIEKTRGIFGKIQDMFGGKKSE
jgi:ATP-dependent RNA helicase RhlB